MVFKKISIAIAVFSLLLPAFMSGFYVFKPQSVNAAPSTDPFTSSGSWTAPANVYNVTIEAWGGGGSGPAGSAAGGKGGGGGGAYASQTVSVVPGNNYTVTVGTGGVPGSGGGDSWFSTSGTVLAKGGSVGTATTGGAGGSGGSSIGSVKHNGGNGGNRSANGNGGGGGGGSATSSANGGNGGVANGGGSGGSGEGSGGSGGGNNSVGSNGSSPGGGGGGGGSNRVSGNGAGGLITITYEPVIISVIVSDGAIDYGIVAANASKDTTSGGLNDTQIATNDGSGAQNFNIRGQSSASWTLAGSIGSDQYKHEFCTSGSGSPDPCDSSPTWTALTSSYQSLATNIAASGNRRFDLKISTPSSTNATDSQSVDVIIQAVSN